jgi:ubiquinone/menaquinone biosynthesis C-methylase UbiE
MVAGVERYVIRGGHEGYNRLLLLARASWPDTAALFSRAGIRPGMKCVDLGCGGGEVTFELARLVAPGGSVTGVDMDEVKLGLARTAAVERGIGNVEFTARNVNSWDEPDGYDVVYSRYLLQHLSEPVDLLRRMWAAVRSGGLVIVEDADFDGWCCHPPNEGFDFFVRAYAEVIRRRGGDHATGRKLYHYFLEAGIPTPHVDLVQSVFVSGEGKELARSTLDATSEAILSEGVATSDELAAALASLRQFTDDDTTLIARPAFSSCGRPGNLRSRLDAAKAGPAGIRAMCTDSHGPRGRCRYRPTAARPQCHGL